MNRTITTTLAVILLAGCLSGCTRNLEQRIILLEDTNRMLEQNNQALTEANQGLADQLDRARADMGLARRDLATLKTRVLAASRDADQLRDQIVGTPAPVPPPPPAVTLITAITSEVFTVGKATLRDEARTALDAVVSRIQGEFAGEDILVIGHTDNRPIKKSGWKDNYQLSSERALAVVRYLREQGVSPDRLIAAGCGEHRPRSSNKTAAGQTANRRVEIYAVHSTELRH
jgi:outer membrane protein OmpA-like peptidoglycan-associated protein